MYMDGQDWPRTYLAHNELASFCTIIVIIIAIVIMHVMQGNMQEVPQHM